MGFLDTQQPADDAKLGLFPISDMVYIQKGIADTLGNHFNLSPIVEQEGQHYSKEISLEDIEPMPVPQINSDILLYMILANDPDHYLVPNKIAPFRRFFNMKLRVVMEDPPQAKYALFDYGEADIKTFNAVDFRGRIMGDIKRTLGKNDDRCEVDLNYMREKVQNLLAFFDTAEQKNVVIATFDDPCDGRIFYTNLVMRLRILEDLFLQGEIN